LLGERAFLAKHSDTHRIECGEIGAGGNIRQRRVGEANKIGHGRCRAIRL
jgi:hypothetical protein